MARRRNGGGPAPGGTPPRMMATLARGVAMFALAKGVPMAELTEATGVTAEELLKADAWLPANLMARMWLAIRAHYPNNAVALEMARLMPRSLFGEFGELMSTLPDLRSVMRFAARNHALVDDRLEFDVFEGPHESGFRMYHPADDLDGGCAAEFGVAMAARIAIALFGGDVIRRIEFRHQPHGPEREYADFFGVIPRFGCPTNSLITSASDFDRPNVEATPDLHLFVQQRLDTVHSERQTNGPSDSALDLLSAVAYNAARADFTVEGLARRLGVSDRSLQRLARLAGATPRELLSRARQAHAVRLLRDPALSVDQIAEELGYSTERSFRRAFERWVGKTPAQFRRDK